MLGPNAMGSGSATRVARPTPPQPIATSSATAMAPSLISPTPSSVKLLTTGGGRKVRTIPPSASLEPPTPPTESQPTFDSSAPLLARPKPKHRRRPRYESSSDSSDADDESDDEPPWWTFTQKGMVKLRQMGERGTRHDAAETRGGLSGAEGESGAEGITGRHEKDKEGREGYWGVPDLVNWRKQPKRQHSAGEPGPSSKAAARTPNNRENGGISTPALLEAATARLFTNRRTSSDINRRGSSDNNPQERNAADSPKTKAKRVGSEDVGLSRSRSRPGLGPKAKSIDDCVLPRSNSDGGLQALADLGARRVASPEPQTDPASGAGSDSATPSLSPSRVRKRPMYRRGLTMPHLRRSLEGNAESLTDSETAVRPSPRNRAAKQRMWSTRHAAVPEEGGDTNDSDNGGVIHPVGTQTKRPKRNVNNLRIRLPPPMREHFADGWPHAGSWQNALRYGVLTDDEDMVFPKPPGQGPVQPPAQGGQPHVPSSITNAPAHPSPLAQTTEEATRKDSRDNSAPNIDPIDGPAGVDYEGPHRPANSPRRQSTATSHSSSYVTPASNMPSSSQAGSLPRPVSRRNSGEAIATVKAPARVPQVDTSVSSSLEKPVKAARRKTKRTKRYRPTLVPPTPGGIGFGPALREKDGQGWGVNSAPNAYVDPNTNPFDRENPFERIEEEDLSPQMTAVSEMSTRRPGLFSRFGRRPKQHRPVDDLDWRARLRRQIFLDARVTIYLRVVNLAVVAVLLGLSVSIRKSLERLGVPGIIGASTTLIIAYSAFTIIHVLTAIFREWFGRPIGLWGLRSKMLWVCLDLLFIALWSSATTLSINDFVDTPLDCTPAAPWWSSGDDFYGTGLSSPATNGSLNGVQHRSKVFLRVDSAVPESVKQSSVARDVCARQIGCIAVCIVALVLYLCNMVLSLFRIFETVRRTANPHTAVMWE